MNRSRTGRRTANLWCFGRSQTEAVSLSSLPRVVPSGKSPASDTSLDGRPTANSCCSPVRGIGSARRAFTLSTSTGGSRVSLPAEIFAGVSPLHVAWRPDGRAVSVWGRDARDRWTLVTSPLDGGPSTRSSLSPDVERRFLNSDVLFDRFVWGRSGTHLFFEGSSAKPEACGESPSILKRSPGSPDPSS